VGSPNEFSGFVEVLNVIENQARTSGQAIGTLTGLEGFCEAWNAASGRKEFRKAQVMVLDEL
jgi:hypothetical protein